MDHPEYPAVAIMKWRGDDALRSGATRRFILEGQAGLGIGGEPDFGQFDATAASILNGDAAGDQGDGVAGGGDGRADPRRYADRARDISSRARDDGVGGPAKINFRISSSVTNKGTVQ
jgi:hypothetical protein